MKNLLKTDTLLFYIICSLLTMEIVFRFATMAEPFSNELLLSIVFSISIAFTLYLIGSFFQGTARFVLSIVQLGIVSVIYSSQLVYYKIFKTYYSIYSIGNGGQVAEFWKDITSLIYENALWVLAIFSPVILLLFGRKLFSFAKIEWLNKLSLVISIVLTQVAGMTIVFASGKGENSPFDLYFKNNIPQLSAERLGLITTMRLDLQRLILGWTDSNKASGKKRTDYLPAIPPVKNKEDVPEKKLEYNTMKIDFSSLFSSEKDEDVKELHEYFQQVQPTEKNDFTGKYKDYNLIFITAEGFSPYAVRQDITPTLYKLVHDGYNFTNFYNPIWGVSTSDGEYVACTGLIPKAGVWSFKESAANYLPFVMGNQLKKLGYQTNAYHNHSYTYYGRDQSHPNMGYVYKGVGNGLEVKKTWPESDIEMMEKTIPEYIHHQPFHAYYMTVSGHLRYSFSGNYIAHKNKQIVSGLPYSDEAKAYLATQVELDRALKYLLDSLDKAGIADKTLIALSADHYPYGLDKTTIDELAGHPVENNFELYKSTFILYTKGMKPMTVDKPASSLDIIPTLSNLLGLEYDSRLLMGRDIFSNAPPLIIFNNKSFITDKGRYNSLTRTFTPVTEDTIIDGAYVQNISSIVRGKFYFSAKILDTDYYRRILGE